MNRQWTGRLAAGLAVWLAAGAALGAEGAGSAPAAAGEAAEIRRLFEAGNWQAGLAALRRVPETANESGDLAFLRAMAAMETGDYRAAFRHYQALLARYPNEPSLKNNLAWVRVKSADPAIRNLDLALREAQEAVFAQPRDPNIWNTLGEVYLARGDAARAMRLAVLARDLAAQAGVPDLRVFQDLVRRCGERAGAKR